MVTKRGLLVLLLARRPSSVLLLVRREALALRGGLPLWVVMAANCNSWVSGRRHCGIHACSAAIICCAHRGS
jgi:hypothetical protein